MKKIFMAIILFPSLVFSQFTETFDDGDFSTLPSWQGDTVLFLVNDSGLLQLQDTFKLGQASLFTLSSAIMDAQWEFFVNLDFNPSSSNYLDVFLAASSVNFSQANGYFVRIGNSEDGISLYKSSAGHETLIIDGKDDRVDLNPVIARIKVTRDGNGNWELFSDTTGQANYFIEGRGVDSAHLFNRFFGFRCKYTSTRADKFFMDDIFVGGEPYIDSIKPMVVNVLAISPSQIAVTFSEMMDSTAALTEKYLLNGSVSPSGIQFFRDSLVLCFDENFMDSKNHLLSVFHLSDLFGNIIDSLGHNFVFHQPKQNDVLITEILADPSPTVQLPNYEYIELFNNSNWPVSLLNWKIIAGSTEKVLPDYTLQPDSFVILCHGDAVMEYSGYGKSIGIFTSQTSITNAGTSIYLSDNYDSIIHQVDFQENWYEKSEFSDGGWSLEIIQPSKLCNCSFNWKVSGDPTGGTPGKINSSWLDKTAPEVIKISVIKPKKISLKFSENCDSSIFQKNNYYLNGAEVVIDSMQVFSDSVQLFFNQKFTESTNYTLSISNISDKRGNVLTGFYYDFSIYYAKPHDVVINEIMADPEPVVLLPGYEYIELFNKSEFDLELKGWTLLIGSKEIVFPDINIETGSYLIICPEEFTGVYGHYGNTAGLLSSSGNLVNSGNSVVLRNENNQLIDFVNYSDEWYRDDYKEGGGWSLEQVDPSNPCGEADNWMATDDPNGGTPGKINAVFAENEDIIAPEISGIGVVGDTAIVLYFSEAFDSVFNLSRSSFEVDHGIGNPLGIKHEPPYFKSVVLEFEKPFEVSYEYILTVTTNFSDCAGNLLESDNMISFSVPEPADSLDLIINELLFNPVGDAADYIEIYNASNKVIDLKNIKIAGRDEETLELESIIDVSETSKLLFPGEICAFTTDIQGVVSNYYPPGEAQIMEINSMPAYNNESGRAVICDWNKNVLDEFVYNENMHYALLNDFEGVSLERISYTMASNNQKNWHSAAQTVNFGTPGYENSQHAENLPAESKISVSPEVFSPDNDGYQDVLFIGSKLSAEGYMANISIFDAKGRLVSRVAQNELLGTENTFSWDGRNLLDEIPPVGIYIVYVELFNLNGELEKIKKTCVLAGSR